MPAETIHVNTEDVTLPAAARTASGQSGAVRVGGMHTVRAHLNVTAAGGTAPTLNVALETSHDGVTWRSASAFAQATAVTQERRAAAGLDQFVRWAWTVGGTAPTFTFSITATMVGG